MNSMIRKGELLFCLWLMVGLVACSPADSDRITPTPTNQSAPPSSQPQPATASATPQPTALPASTPVPTETAVPIPTNPPTPTATSAFTQTAVFGEPIAQRLLSLTNGRFAIQTVRGFDIYDEAAMTAVSQFISLDSPDIATATLTGSAEHLIWRAENGRLFVQRLQDNAIILQVPGHPNGWQHPGFSTSPQGNFGWLREGDSYSEDPFQVTLYRLQDGAELAQFEGSSPQFTADDAFFIRETAEELLVYDSTQPAQPRYALKRAPKISYWSVELMGSLMVVTSHFHADDPPMIELREVATGELLYTHSLAEDEKRIAFPPDGQAMAISFEQYDSADIPTLLATGVRLYSLESGQQLYEITTPAAPSQTPVPAACEGVRTFYAYEPDYVVSNITFAPDGRTFTVVYRSDAGHLTHLYATDSGQKLAEFVGYTSLFLANGRSLVSLSPDGLAQRWDTTISNAPPQTIASYGTPINDLALSTDGQLVALVNGIGVEMRRTADGERLQQYNEATAVAFTPDGETMVLGFADGRIQWRSLVDDSLLNEISGHEAPVRRIAFLPDQPEPTVLALAENDCQLTRWQLTIGQQLGPLDTALTFSQYGDPFQESIDDFVVSPTGDLVAGRAWFNYGFGVWHLADDRRIFTELEDSPQTVADMAFNSNGRLLATGERWPVGGWIGPERGGLRLWQIEDRAATLLWQTELNQYVGDVAFSTNGSLLAVGYSSGDVNLVSARMQKFVGRLDTASGVTGMAFGGNGRLLAATTHDGLTYIWQIEPPN